MDTTFFAMDPTPSLDYADYMNITLSSNEPDLSLEGLKEAFLKWRPDLWEVTKVTLLCFTMVMAIIGNSIIISVSRRLFQQSSVLGSILTSLALSHMFFGLTVPIHIGPAIIPNFLNLPELCIAYHASVAFFVTLTLVHLFLIAVDRAVALAHPLRFHKVLQHWHMTIILTLAWIYAAGSAGALLLWQLDWVPNSGNCHPEVHFGLVYRIVHLAEYGLCVIVAMPMLIHVYFNSCKKQRLRRVMKHGRRRRKPIDYSLRRNKLFSETGITLATLFFGVCGPLMAVNVIHIVSDRNALTTAIEKIGILVVLVHTFFNSLVLPWKIRSFRHRCVFCLCPCTEGKGSGDDTSDEDGHDKITHISVRHLAHNGDIKHHTLGQDSFTDSLTNSQTNTVNRDTTSKHPIPNIVITDYDSQKRLALRSDGKLDIIDKDGNKNIRFTDTNNEALTNEVIWSTMESHKPTYFDGTSVNSMYLLDPIDGEFPNNPREDEV